MRFHPQLMQVVDVADARYFFETVVPSVLSESSIVGSGRIRFEVSGLGWTLDLDEGRVYEDVASDVDVTIATTREALDGVVAGRYNSVNVRCTGGSEGVRVVEGLVAAIFDSQTERCAEPIAASTKRRRRRRRFTQRPPGFRKCRPKLLKVGSDGMDRSPKSRATRRRTRSDRKAFCATNVARWLRQVVKSPASGLA